MRINNTCRHTLWEHLSGGLEDLTSSANPRSWVGSILELPNRNSHCPPPCHKRGISRIVLVEKTSEDGCIHLEPIYHGCTCQPFWRKQHQRQLINAGLRNTGHLTKQISTLKTALEDMLARHREISKTELNQEKYWLRQEYARMDDSRAQKNHLKDREAERMRRMAGSIGASQGMIGTHDSQDFLQVDRDDLWVDAEYYEFLIDEDLDALPNVKAITPQEVLRRFNDLERRATAIVRDWEAEDATLAKLISTAYPQPGPTDCRYSDFSTYLVAGSSEEERTEVLRCDMWANLQQAVVTDRSVEMRELLLEIKQHLSKQMGEIDAAQGVQGRRRALLSYLTRYEDGQDLQLAERVPASADTTWMILAKAEVMIEGWEAKDVATKRRFDEMVLNEEALEAM